VTKILELFSVYIFINTYVLWSNVNIGIFVVMMIMMMMMYFLSHFFYQV